MLDAQDSLTRSRLSSPSMSVRISSSLDEAHLQVELGELGLAVGAQVLVAEAAHDLEVAVEARRPSAAA